MWLWKASSLFKRGFMACLARLSLDGVCLLSFWRDSHSSAASAGHGTAYSRASHCGSFQTLRFLSISEYSLTWRLTLWLLPLYTCHCLPQDVSSRTVMPNKRSRRTVLYAASLCSGQPRPTIFHRIKNPGESTFFPQLYELFYPPYSLLDIWNP